MGGPRCEFFCSRILADMVEPGPCGQEEWVLKNSPTGKSFELGDFPVGVSRFLFLSQMGTVADSRDLDLRKRASRFRFWAVAARKNCSRTCFILRKRTLRSPIWFFNSAKSASTFRRWRC